MVTEEVKILDRYYKETDPIEKAYLWYVIKENGFDLLNYFSETCAFCGRLEVLRKCQQIVLYESNVSSRMQNWREGILAFRCHDCRDRKQKIAKEIKTNQRESVRFIDDTGFITDLSSYELYLDLIDAGRKKAKHMNKALNGMILSSLDDVTDFTLPMSDEQIRKQLITGSIEAFLNQRKREGYLKWNKK